MYQWRCYRPKEPDCCVLPVFYRQVAGSSTALAVAAAVVCLVLYRSSSLELLSQPASRPAFPAELFYYSDGTSPPSNRVSSFSARGWSEYAEGGEYEGDKMDENRSRGRENKEEEGEKNEEKTEVEANEN